MDEPITDESLLLVPLKEHTEEPLKKERKALYTTPDEAKALEKQGITGEKLLEYLANKAKDLNNEND